MPNPRNERAFPLTPDAATRKRAPMAEGVLDYFPNALYEVARVSHAGNEQHNPGQPLHWARGKSAGHADSVMRHLVDRGTLDNDGIRHSAKLAWRALALLQEELEAEFYGEKAPGVNPTGPAADVYEATEAYAEMLESQDVEDSSDSGA